MADHREEPIRLQLDLAADQPGLLAGLEAWVQLGLISEAQVLAIAQTQLTCELPPCPAPHPTPEGAKSLDHPPVSTAGERPQATATRDFLPTEAAEAELFRRLPPPPSPARRRGKGTDEPIPTNASGVGRGLSSPSASPRETVPRPPSATSVWLNRLMNELSVVWLLGLGVFLVVLSSAVLAATQWARFNAVGQYLVLLAYTLAFWGVGLGCGRRDNLQLTAKTLQMITLLLVPLNFWAMDGLGVWGAPGGLLLGVGATLGLTLVALQALRQQQSSPLEQGNALGLAYLHTGWSLAGIPVLAVYLGVAGSAIATLYRQLHRADPQQTSNPHSAISPAVVATPGPGAAIGHGAGDAGSIPTPAPKLHLPTLTIGITLALLLLRALTVINPTQWGQFGLAFGLYAATWVWLGQRHLSPNLPTPNPQISPSSSTLLPTTPPPHYPPLTRWPILIGRLLLLWSWLLTLTDWLAQALGISALGLGLRIQALQKLGKRRDLLVAYGIAVQLGFVSWELLPPLLRQNATGTLATWMGAAGWPTALLGISLFPYVVGMVALGDWYHRRQRIQLGRFSDGIALGSNVLLTLISLLVGRVLVVNLIASTVTAFVVAGRRTPRRQGQILTSYGLAIATILVTLGQRWPNFPLEHWAAVITTLAVTAILLSQVLPDLWGKSAWLYGLGLSALTYGLLWWHLLTHTANLQSPWTILGLAIPLAFTLVGRHVASVPTTALSLLFTLGMPWTRLIGLATVTVLSATNGYVLRRPLLPFLTVAYGLGLIVAGVDYAIPAFPRHWTDWYGLITILTLILWAIWRTLLPVATAAPDLPPSSHHSPTPLSPLYRTACDQWGHLLTLGILTAMTLSPHWLVAGHAPKTMPLVALVGVLLALALRYGGQVQPATVYLAGWTGQLLVAEAMAWHWGSPLALAVPTLGLGALSLALATGLARSRPNLVAPLQHLTLAYAGLALVLRSYTATAWTGWLVVVASLLGLEIGRRGQHPLARWLALVGLSVGWYELVLYQMLQAPAGATADGLIVLAAVAALIMAVYRGLAGQLQARWGLPPVEWMVAAHLHWGFGSVLMLGAGLWMGLATATLAWVGVAIAAALLLYALLQGRLGERSDLKAAWVYAGLIELVGWFALVRLASPGLAGLDSWWGVVACGVAVPIYWIPWANRGWPQRPWRVMAIAVPLIITLLTQGIDHIPTLWVLVGFYGWLAWHSGRLRVSYLAVGLAVWAIWLWLDQQSIQDDLAWMVPLSLALLYIAQLDPGLRHAEAKPLRHWLRVAAAGIVLFPALASTRWTGWPVGAISLGVLAAGLALRIRAFLYVGTLVFALNTLNQLVLLNATYPFMKWVMGIAVGISLIWMAADFERRRTQWLQLTQSWLQDLDSWQ